MRIRIGEYRHYGIQSPSFNRSLIYAVKDTTIIHPNSRVREMKLTNEVVKATVNKPEKFKKFNYSLSSFFFLHRAEI